ncbi:hypothetical protein Ocin01_15442 [Orchesella cincta]|uniref:Uncharacterized protein n=1 Tax=Orchesella cincta TaxID=48709 RepID=A0A1D2ME61_ORCCI|nr:hypothetical protein Ocin01_15442 [Orchesella cincta]
MIMANNKKSINRFFASTPKDVQVHPETSYSQSSSTNASLKKVQLDIQPPSTSVSTVSSTAPTDTSGQESSKTAARRFTVPRKSLLAIRKSVSALDGDLEEGTNEPRKTITGTRTFRIWHPQSDKKSIVVNVGKEVDPNAEKVFESENINAKDFVEWKKEAKAQLPSVTGGNPVETLDEVVDAGPSIKKEDAKTGQQIIRRLSLEDKAPLRKSIPVVHVEDYSHSGHRKHSYDEDSLASTVVDVESDEDDDDIDRKHAGHDIKGKIKTLKELAEHLTSKRAIRQQLVLKATGSTVLDTEGLPISRFFHCI